MEAAVSAGRGLLQTVQLHRGVIGNPRYGSFGLYTAFNVLTMVLVPCLQILLLLLLPVAYAVDAGQCRRTCLA